MKTKAEKVAEKIWKMLERNDWLYHTVDGEPDKSSKPKIAEILAKEYGEGK